MSRRPLSPEVWEQALVNGRRIHPSDSEAATAWSEAWYVEQGGRFSDDLTPVENTMSDEEFKELIAQSDHAPGPFEPEPAPDEVFIPNEQPTEPAQPQAEEPKRPHRRVRRQD